MGEFKLKDRVFYTYSLYLGNKMHKAKTFDVRCKERALKKCNFLSVNLKFMHSFARFKALFIIINIFIIILCIHYMWT